MNKAPRRRARSLRAPKPRAATARTNINAAVVGKLLEGFRKSTADLTQFGRELQQITQQATQALQQAVNALADEVRRSEEARNTIEQLQRQIQQLTADPGYSIARASRAGSQR